MHTGLRPPLEPIITLAIKAETGFLFRPEKEFEREGESDRRAEDRWGEGEGRREPAYFTSIHLLTWPLKETFH